MDFLNEQLQIANVYLLNLCDGCSQSAERFHQPTGDRSGGRFRRRCCGMPCLRLSTGKLLLAAQSSNYRYSSHLTRTVSLTGSVRLDFFRIKHRFNRRFLSVLNFSYLVEYLSIFHTMLLYKNWSLKKIKIKKIEMRCFTRLSQSWNIYLWSNPLND